jgi:hypothetical protein
MYIIVKGYIVQLYKDVENKIKLLDNVFSYQPVIGIGSFSKLSYQPNPMHMNLSLHSQGHRQ